MLMNLPNMGLFRRAEHIKIRREGKHGVLGRFLDHFWNKLILEWNCFQLCREWISII